MGVFAYCFIFLFGLLVSFVVGLFERLWVVFVSACSGWLGCCSRICWCGISCIPLLGLWGVFALLSVFCWLVSLFIVSLCFHISSHIVLILISLFRSGQVHVGQVYLSRRIPMCCSSRALG